jgi:predicted RNase H-like HicB family nuclease
MRPFSFLRSTKPKIPVLTIAVRREIKHDPKTGEYWATCPALPGLLEVGNSEEQLESRLTEGIFFYFESLCRDGLPIPAGPDCIVKVDGAPVAFGGGQVVEMPKNKHSSQDWATAKWPIPKMPDNSLEALLQTV